MATSRERHINRRRRTVTECMRHAKYGRKEQKVYATRERRIATCNMNNVLTGYSLVDTNLITVEEDLPARTTRNSNE